jgi:HD-like signal output (HDOD) protein
LLIEFQAFPELFAELIERAEAADIDFLACERQLTGVDHQLLGVGLAAKFNLPLHFRVAAGFHHNPEMLTADLRPLGMVLRMADTVCCQENFAAYRSASAAQVPQGIFAVLPISRNQIDEVRKLLAGDVACLEATLSG